MFYTDVPPTEIGNNQLVELPRWWNGEEGNYSKVYVTSTCVKTIVFPLWYCASIFISQRMKPPCFLATRLRYVWCYGKFICAAVWRMLFHLDTIHHNSDSTAFYSTPGFPSSYPIYRWPRGWAAWLIHPNPDILLELIWNANEGGYALAADRTFPKHRYESALSFLNETYSHLRFLS